MSFGGGDVASLGIGLGVDPASFDPYGGIVVPGTDVSVGPTVQGMLTYDSLAPLAHNEFANQADQATIGGTFSSPSLLQSASNFLDANVVPSERGPGILASGLPFPFSVLPTLVTRGADALGLEAGDFYGGQGGFESDLAAISTPSAEDIAVAQRQMQPVMPEPEPVPVVVAAPTASQIYATAQPYYRRTLLDAAPAGFADFAALNDAFNRSYAMRPAIYQTPPAVDLLGRQGFVPLA